MKAVFKGIEIEGTPAEIAEFINSIDGSATQPALGQLGDSGEGNYPAGPDEESSITPEFAYRILKRIPLSEMQKAFLGAVKSAHPDWVLASQIQNKLSWSGNQLGGVLGGLGRRLSATKGVKSSDALWIWTWDDDEGEYAYRLPSASVEALNRLGL